ncbi:MAG: UDP-2,3-diacylglucosamine diphosphatase [Planctomycetes bacterium]|nr:UDP-2,3-diacylglucosamine diphosphatase [Planctomycetota bacterium]
MTEAVATDVPPAPLRFAALLVADLHLTPADAPGLARLTEFLRLAPAHAPELWILGDLFDLWLTGDERALPAFAPLLAAFRAAAASGLVIRFLPGNRDFNFTRADGAAVGITVSEQEEVDATLGGTPTRLLHGDQLLTGDHGYQALKRVVRSGPARWLARHLPAALPLAIGRRIRRYSDRVVPRKEAGRLRIVAAEVERRLAAGARRVVCGHVHRLERWSLPAGELLVLPPFCDRGEFVAVAGLEPAAALCALPPLWLGTVGGALVPLPTATAPRGAGD